MKFLFDTNALSELLRPRPNAELAAWVATLPRRAQCTSAVVVSELYAGAFMATERGRWLRRIERQILPRLDVLPFDTACAKACGEVDAFLRAGGCRIGRADTEIAATALVHGLCVVTANIAHFERIPRLQLRSFQPGNRS